VPGLESRTARGLSGIYESGRNVRRRFSACAVGRTHPTNPIRQLCAPPFVTSYSSPVSSFHSFHMLNNNVCVCVCVCKFVHVRANATISAEVEVALTNNTAFSVGAGLHRPPSFPVPSKDLRACGKRHRLRSGRGREYQRALRTGITRSEIVVVMHCDTSIVDTDQKQDQDHDPDEDLMKHVCYIRALGSAIRVFSETPRLPFAFSSRFSPLAFSGWLFWCSSAFPCPLHRELRYHNWI
jgi:hypothetical protein